MNEVLRGEAPGDQEGKNVFMSSIALIMLGDDFLDRTMVEDLDWIDSRTQHRPQDLIHQLGFHAKVIVEIAELPSQRLVQPKQPPEDTCSFSRSGAGKHLRVFQCRGRINRAVTFCARSSANRRETPRIHFLL